MRETDYGQTRDTRDSCWRIPEITWCYVGLASQMVVRQAAHQRERRHMHRLCVTRGEGREGGKEREREMANLVTDVTKYGSV